MYAILPFCRRVPVLSLLLASLAMVRPLASSAVEDRGGAQQVAEYPYYACGLTSDYRIAVVRVDSKTGALIPLSAGQFPTTGQREMLLVAHPSGNYLYTYPKFDVGQDGYSSAEFGIGESTPHRRTTEICAWRINRYGRVSLLQRFVVPALISELQAHPKGKLLYAVRGDNHLQAIHVLPNGRLRLGVAEEAFTGMGLMDAVGERDAWCLTFSPDGNYLYNFRGDGFIEHFENYLYFHRVGASGRLSTDGRDWVSRDSDVEGVYRKASDDPGWVWVTPYRTALMMGFQKDPWVCAIDTSGRLLATGKPRHLPVTSPISIESPTVPFSVNPRLPFLYLKADQGKPKYSVWQITGPGRLRRAAPFRSAFSAGGSTLRAGPTGTYLYDFGASAATNYTPSYAVFRCDKSGAVSLSRRPVICPEGITSTLLFIRPRQ